MTYNLYICETKIHFANDTICNQINKVRRIEDGIKLIQNAKKLLIRRTFNHLQNRLFDIETNRKILKHQLLRAYHRRLAPWLRQWRKKNQSLAIINSSLVNKIKYPYRLGERPII